MTKIIMHGCNGKMGRVICDIVEKDKNSEIVAGIDINPENAKFPTFTNINDCNMSADVIIDFSTALAVPNLIEYCKSKKMPLVICTTGLSSDTLELIQSASNEIPIFKSANMSVGINLIANILNRISPLLFDNNFDIEIIEKHHNQKIDSPSGTAFLLADSINSSMENKLSYVYDRTKEMKKRDKNEIGISAIRGGTIVGEHSVIFAGKDEVIELSHFAYSKEVFAVGAVNAAKFLAKKSAGLYDMQNLMNEIYN